MIKELLQPFPKLATVHQYLQFYLRRPRYRSPISSKAQALFLQLATEGYVVLENYFTAEECTALCQDLFHVFQQFPEYVHQKSDRRFFGIDKAIPTAKRFADDPLFQELANAVNGLPSQTAFTMAGVLSAESRGSSGEGWHRDAFFSQFKAMAYLTNVGLENGPFEILSGSHRLQQILRDINTANLRQNQNRLSDEETSRLIEAEPNRLKTLTASAGTVILFNSSTVHRGRPIVKGERIALTNYVYEESHFGEWMIRHFAPLYPHSMN